jgi:hypothetical protein
LVRAGQGLVLWQGYTSGKSENVLGISKTNQGIRPSTAVDENLFFRGVATTLNFGKAKLRIFYSQKNDDGNVVRNRFDRPIYHQFANIGLPSDKK